MVWRLDLLDDADARDIRKRLGLRKRNWTKQTRNYKAKAKTRLETVYRHRHILNLNGHWGKAAYDLGLGHLEPPRSSTRKGEPKLIEPGSLPDDPPPDRAPPDRPAPDDPTPGSPAWQTT